MSTDRMRRVDEAIREVLSDALGTDLKDPRIGFVTVTAVNTSPDLRRARVFVTVLGTDEERAASLAARGPDGRPPPPRPPCARAAAP